MNKFILQECAKEYLCTEGKSEPWARVLLEYGQPFISPSKEVVQEIVNNGWLGEIGHCYSNALHWSDAYRKRDGSTMYVEGIALCPSGVLLHAWLGLDGRVVDYTWPDADEILYFGIPFEPSWSLMFAETVGRYGVLGNMGTCESMVIEYLQKSRPAH